MSTYFLSLLEGVNYDLEANLILPQYSQQTGRTYMLLGVRQGKRPYSRISLKQMASRREGSAYGQRGKKWNSSLCRQLRAHKGGPDIGGPVGVTDVATWGSGQGQACEQEKAM